MYQWRKFEFFEEKTTGKSSSSSMPDEVTGKTECCSSGRGKIVVGSDDGMVTLLDRGFKHIYGFQAHASSVFLLQQLKQRNHLMTIGEDEQISLQLSPICLKVFDLDKKQPEGTSTTSPDCIQILRIFTNQFPEAKITTFLVLEEAPPIMLISIGLNNGCIYCIKGDIARERITRFKLQVENSSEKNQSAITGLGYRVDGQALQLFAVTSASVTLFNLHEQPPRRQTLDQIGSEVNSVTMSDRSELIIGRPEAVYFYEVDGRGPCWAFEETVAMRKEIQDLRTNARIFQLSKCTACTFTLDLPAVHFMCMHSFHQRCLGDNEKECPECAPEHRSVEEMKKSLEQNGRDQDWFFSQVKSSKDGFSVIAEYFGKGVVSKTSNGTLDNLRSGTSSQSGF